MRPGFFVKINLNDGGGYFYTRQLYFKSILMSIYKMLFETALRITGSLDQSAGIVSAAINEGVGIALDTRDPKKAQEAMLTIVRNKSYDYARNSANEDHSKAAEELNEPIGMIRQIVRRIKEGKYY